VTPLRSSHSYSKEALNKKKNKKKQKKNKKKEKGMI
jgi:hypothetical protein